MAVKKITGARLVVDCLVAQGVDTVFGYIGNNVIELYDELYRRRGTIRHITTSHEQGAAHAADGYARATGRVGVAIATSGPGACNLITGIAAAYMDSVPVVFITGNVPTNRLGHDSFQETDIVGMTMGITKHNVLVSDVGQLGTALQTAFAIAVEGRPGPVLVDIPRDVLQAKVLAELPEVLPQASAPIDSAELDRAVELLQQAQRPLLLVGGGAVNASAHVTTLVETLQLPTVHTLLGKGVLPDSHPLSLGLTGLHGTPRAAAAVARCDLLLCIGSRLGERAAEGHGQFSQPRIVHIDIDPAEINKNLRVDCQLIGDAAAVLAALSQRVAAQRHDDWLQQLAAQPPLPQDSSMARLMAIVQRQLDNRTIVTTDVGQHQLWAAQYLALEQPRHWLTSGGLGAMGFGLGAAIGAALGCPGRRVLHITGDGSLMMNAMELATVAQLKLPITTLVLNNRCLGMVRQWQDMRFGGRHSQIDRSGQPDFVALAAAFGIKSVAVDTPEALENALAGRGHGSLLIDCAVPSDERVRPTWVDGADIATNA